MTTTTKYGFALGLLAVLALCVNSNEGGEMVQVKIVENGDTVSVDYTGTLESGEQFDSSIGREPLAFEAGAGQMIKGFDSAVIGMKEGEEKTITLQPNEAYGEPRPELVQDIPLENFDATPTVGQKIQGTANGRTVRGVVLDVNATRARVDFNHDLAGKVLIFKVKLLTITKG